MQILLLHVTLLDSRTVITKSFYHRENVIRHEFFDGYMLSSCILWNVNCVFVTSPTRLPAFTDLHRVFFHHFNGLLIEIKSNWTVRNVYAAEGIRRSVGCFFAANGARRTKKSFWIAVRVNSRYLGRWTAGTCKSVAGAHSRNWTALNYRVTGSGGQCPEHTLYVKIYGTRPGPGVCRPRRGSI